MPDLKVVVPKLAPNDRGYTPWILGVCALLTVAAAFGASLWGAGMVVGRFETRLETLRDAQNADRDEWHKQVLDLTATLRALQNTFSEMRVDFGGMRQGIQDIASELRDERQDRLSFEARMREENDRNLQELYRAVPQRTR